MFGRKIGRVMESGMPHQDVLKSREPFLHYSLSITSSSRTTRHKIPRLGGGVPAPAPDASSSGGEFTQPVIRLFLHVYRYETTGAARSEYLTPFFTCRIPAQAFVPSLSPSRSAPPLEKCIISGRCVCKFPRSRSRSKPPSPRRIPKPPTRARVRSVLFRGKLGGGGGGGATDLSGKNCGGALEFWKRRSSFTRRAGAAQNFFKAQFPHHTYLLAPFFPF